MFIFKVQTYTQYYIHSIKEKICELNSVSREMMADRSLMHHEIHGNYTWYCNYNCISNHTETMPSPFLFSQFPGFRDFQNTQNNACR